MNKVTRKMGEEPQVLHKEYSACNSQTIAKVGMAAFGLLGVGSGLAFYFLQLPMIVAMATGTLGGGTLLGTTMWSVIDAIVPPNKGEQLEPEDYDEGPSTSGEWTPNETQTPDIKVERPVSRRKLNEIKLTIARDRIIDTRPFFEGELKYQFHLNPNLDKITVEITASNKGKYKTDFIKTLEEKGFALRTTTLGNDTTGAYTSDRYVFYKTS